MADEEYFDTRLKLRHEDGNSQRQHREQQSFIRLSRIMESKTTVSVKPSPPAHRSSILIQCRDDRDDIHFGLENAQCTNTVRLGQIGDVWLLF